MSSASVATAALPSAHPSSGAWRLGPRDVPRAEPAAPAMDEGTSRIRRRVSVRKRNRPSLEILLAAPTADELKPGDDQKEEEEEEEMAAGSPRRKAVGVPPAEVQPHQIPPEFLVPCPALGAQVSCCAHPLRGVGDRLQKAWDWEL